MADQADTLSIPTNPVRPAAGAMVPTPRVPDLVRPGADPSSAASSLNQRIDQSVGSRDNGVEARKLIVGRETSLSGEITYLTFQVVGACRQGRIRSDIPVILCHQLCHAVMNTISGCLLILI
jgi:hypothetical protein